MVLTDGTEIPADIIVEAVGGAPAVRWLADTGLDLTDGLLNLRLRRSIKVACRSTEPTKASGDALCRGKESGANAR